MRRLLIVSILCLIGTGMVNASIPFDSVELTDSTVIYSSEISTVDVRLNNENAVIDSIETKNGDIINGDLVKKVNKSHLINPNFQNQSRGVLVGGEGSGG